MSEIINAGLDQYGKVKSFKGVGGESVNSIAAYMLDGYTIKLGK